MALLAHANPLAPPPPPAPHFLEHLAFILNHLTFHSRPWAPLQTLPLISLLPYSLNPVTTPSEPSAFSRSLSFSASSCPTQACGLPLDHGFLNLLRAYLANNRPASSHSLQPRTWSPPQICAPLEPFTQIHTHLSLQTPAFPPVLCVFFSVFPSTSLLSYTNHYGVPL